MFNLSLNYDNFYLLTIYGLKMVTSNYVTNSVNENRGHYHQMILFSHNNAETETRQNQGH